jgi:hypothetical protein
MAITDQQKKKAHLQAAAGYALKLKFEKVLAKKIKNLFNTIYSEFKKHYSKYGVAQDVSKYHATLEKILNEHYLNVASKFSNNLRKIYGPVKNNKTIQRHVDSKIKGAAAQRAHMMAHNIIDTTRDNINDAIAMAHEEAIKQKSFIQTKKEEKPLGIVIELAPENLKTKLEGRITTISITETNSDAEESKSLEYDALIETDAETEDGEVISEKKAQKMWTAILDERTRDAHAEADGQIVDEDEPYNVGGEELMEPGDDSLGASDENICNCRCDSQIILT